VYEKEYKKHHIHHTVTPYDTEMAPKRKVAPASKKGKQQQAEKKPKADKCDTDNEEEKGGIDTRRVLIDEKDPVNGIYNFVGRDVYVIRYDSATVKPVPPAKFNWYKTSGPRARVIRFQVSPVPFNDNGGTRVYEQEETQVIGLQAGLPHVLVTPEVAEVLQRIGYDGEVYTTGESASVHWTVYLDCPTAPHPNVGLIGWNVPPTCSRIP